MPVTRDDVVNAYRMILGREPESEIVIAQAMKAENLARLRQAFLDSPEFALKYQRGSLRQLPVGRFLDVSQVDVDIACTPKQLRAMFDRIGRAWQAFGETEPHWSVLTDDAYRQGNLADNIDRFYRSGLADIDVYLNWLRRLGHHGSFAKALDFGCGVGRLTLAVAPHADHVVGVDISPPHLNLAVERARKQSCRNVAFESIASVDDLDRYHDFQLVISRLVLQHNPPPVMAAIYHKLLAALAPGGVAIVQMPTFIYGQSFSVAKYLANEQPQMEMNALPQPYIYKIIEKAGCQVCEVREDGSVGDHYWLSHVFVVQKK